MSDATAATRLPPVALASLPSISETPLVELRPPEPLPAGVRAFAKLEGVHPGGSIKDRPARAIVTAGLAEGRLVGRRLLDSSSGNAGISYAMLGAALGVGVTLVIPGNASRERLERMRAHGAELILTDPLEGYDEAVRQARRLAERHPERYWYANQYANPNNWRAHYATTGVELLRQLRARTGRGPDAFVAGVGTGGTLTGIGRRLRSADAGVHLAAIVPETFPGIEGLKPLGAPDDIVPEILDETLIDERIPVTAEEAAAACRWLAGRGLFVGPSSGAYVHAALGLARSGRHRVVTTILNDSGERYGSTGLWRSEGTEEATPA